ncbi:MAG: hypothetical protein LBP87_12400 [Planctomycetaceae bacterium]|nr:hypothetical protein [Planctomycetaceae bacterium]
MRERRFIFPKHFEALHFARISVRNPIHCRRVRRPTFAAKRCLHFLFRKRTKTPITL